MYRVMIVDDEEPVIDSFSFIINKYVTDFTLIHKARSGREAIELIKKSTPDLVFMDIQMPGLNGIDTIRELKPLFPDIIFILATAYERFDIAQKAIKLGVFNYLVKPVSKNRILEELEKAKKYLDDKNISKTNHLEDAQYIALKKEEIKSEFLQKFVWKSPTTEEWDDFCNMFLVKSEKAMIYLLGGVVNGGTIIDKIQFKYNCFTANLGGKLLFLFPDNISLGKLDNYLSKILTELSLNNVTLGRGKLYHYSELTKSYMEAMEPFYKNIDLDNKFAVHRDILNSDRKVGKKLFEKYWTDIFYLNDFTIAKGKMVALFTLLTVDFDRHLLVEFNFNLDIAESIIPLTDMATWREWANSSIDKIFNIIESKSRNVYPDILKLALNYISENYGNQIQLTVVAEHCLVSSSYLSRIFSEHMGITFVDYLNKFRIDQSLRLLKEKTLTIKEIGFRVGFQDPNYYSRIFRKYMGFSPSSIDKRS